VTDRQTDRQTELRWLRRAKVVAAFARKNQLQKIAHLNYNYKLKNSKSHNKIIILNYLHKRNIN